MKNLSLLSLITFLALVFSLNTIADDELPSHKVTKVKIRENATIEVMPDTFATTVTFSDEDSSSQDAQTEVNKQIKNAISIIKKANIEYNLGSFSTYQKYKSKNYVASQKISLESKDIKKLKNVVSILQQSNGKVTNTRSFMSEKQTQKYFEELFTTAYKKVENKANFITKTINGKNFVITEINYYLNGNNNSRVYAMKAMENSAADVPENERINIDDNKKDITLELNTSITILPKQPGK